MAMSDLNFGLNYVDVLSNLKWISGVAIWRFLLFWVLVKSTEIETWIFNACSFTLSNCYKILYSYHITFVKILRSRIILFLYVIKFGWREIIYLCVEILSTCTSIGTSFLFMYFHFFVILFVFTYFFFDFVVSNVETLKVLFWFVFSLEDVMLL